MEKETKQFKGREKIKSYKDLLVWQKAHLLVKKTLKVCRELPKNRETDIVARQLIKAVTSVPANIAEGYGGHFGKGFVKYLEIARGSVTETDYWAYLLNDEKYVNKNEYDDIAKNCRELILMTKSMIDKLRKRQ